MPFRKDPADLDRLIQEGLDQPEIKERLQHVNSKKVTRLVETVRKDGDALWNTAASDIKFHDDLEKKLQADWHQLESLNPARPPILALLQTLFDQVLPPVPFLLVVIYLILGVSVGWSTPFKWLVTITGAAVVALVVTLLILLYVIFKLRDARFQKAKLKVRDQRAAELNIQDTAARLREAETAIFKTLFENGVLRALRRIIGEQLEPVYSTTLNITVAPGLDAAINPAADVIPTPAHRKLKFMLANMRGGSIGIAGPRGAGKTTLIASVCDESITHIDQQQVLTVMTSAPVEYHARDFLLHLFASVCHRLLKRADEKYDRFALKDIKVVEDNRSSRLYRLIPETVVICFIFGTVLVVGSLLLAALNVAAKPLDNANVFAAATGTATTVMPETTLPTPPGPAAATSAKSNTPSNATSTPVQSSQTPNSVEPSKPQAPGAAKYVADFVKELGVTPGVLLAWGLILILVSIALYVASSVWISQLQRLQPDAPPSTIDKSWNPLLDLLRRIGRVLREMRKVRTSPEVSRLLGEAQSWLTKIKFQQSYTTGWAGSLKFGVGLEGTVNKGRSLAEQQLTLPEIVDGFTGLLRLAACDYKVIIGIDELDKMESDEKAQRFLNEIKAIFGLRGVFYLISVSENAMSNFERRGLPFRDVFDSSFDDVIRVDYMNFETAQRLLSERVVGMPVQFQAFCYCNSGGLARELIRSCRGLVETVGPSPMNQLEALSHRLVNRDLASKVRAVSFTAEKIDSEGRNLFLSQIYKLEAEPVGAENLHTAYLDFLKQVKERAADRDGSKANAADLKEMVSLIEELAAYVYYLATVLRVFTNDLEAEMMKQIQDTGALDLLVRSRQALAVDPAVTRSILDSFRTNRGLVPLKVA